MEKQVAIAVIVRDGRVLIGRRPAGVSMAGLWEFPGGKLAPGETPEACVRREVLEEVGLVVQADEKLAQLDHHYPDFCVRLHVFLCHSEGGEARPLATETVLWVRPEELDGFEFPEANAPLIPLVRRHLDPR